MKKKYVLPTIFIISILCLVAGVFVYNHLTNTNLDKDTTPSNTVDMSKPTEEQVADGETTKANTIKADQQATTRPDNTTTNGPISMYASVINTSSDSVVLRFVIDGVHTGTCSLELTKGSEKVTKTESVQPLAASSTCQGYTIAKSELSNGTWNYTVIASLDGGGTTSRVSGEFELQ